MLATTHRPIPVWLAIVAASLPMFMGTLDNLVVTNALPVIGEHFTASIEQLQWVVNAYGLSFATFMLLAVALGDRFGRRTVFVIGIAVFTLSSATAAMSTDTTVLITARAAQGVGAAALMPLSLTLLVGSVADRLRPAAIGIWGGIAGLGVALGPLIGGAVVQGWNWEAIFWLNVPIGIVAFALALYTLPNSHGAFVRADLVGLLLAGPGVFGLIFGIVRGNDMGWGSAEVLGTLIGSIVLLVAFVGWENRTPSPLLPLRLFRNRSFTVANLVGFMFNFGMFGAVFILFQFLQIVQGNNPLQAGILTTPWTLAPMIVAPLTGIVSARIGTRLPMVVGLAMEAAAMIWLAATMTTTVGYGVLLPAFIVAGVGIGMVFAPSSTAVLAEMAPNDHNKASGTNATLREVGLALGIAVLTAVFSGAGGTFTPTGYVDAAIPAISVAAGVLVLSAIMALFLPSGRGPREFTDTPPPTAESPLEPAITPA